MAFTRVQELTLTEALAVAFIEVKHAWFTEKSLTSCLCMFLSERLTPGAFSAVAMLVERAVADGMIEISPGPRGGSGLRITPKGAAFVSEVDLPRDRVSERAQLEGERYAEANANPAPVILNLLQLIPANEPEFEKELDFMNSVFRHWRDHGWLSSKQVAVISAIGGRHGVHVNGKHYVGRGMDEWRRPYLEIEWARQEQEHALKVQERARVIAAKTAQERQRRQHAEAREAALQANRQVKAVLEQMDHAGELDQLEMIVSTIFPNATLSKATRATAYAGAGSKELRTCIAALAFGKPPALVWKKSGQLRQPGADTELWLAITTHPAFQALGRQLSHAN